MSLIKLSGKVAGNRRIRDNNYYIIMFDFRKDIREKEKIYNFVYFVLQKDILEKLRDKE